MKKILMFFLMLILLVPSISEAKTFVFQSMKTSSSATIMPIPNHQSMDWGITSTNVQKWWKKGYVGRNVKIAVLDTGVDGTHPDLKGAIAGGVSFIKGEPYNIDYNGHGTVVAGEIAAQNNGIGSVGISYGAKIYAVKIMDRTGQGNVANLIQGIYWCFRNRMNIINLSLGLSSDEIGTKEFYQLQDAINLAYNHGIMIVAASGNDGLNHVDYPANFKNVIAVGAAYQSYNEKTNQTSIAWADFSNYSSKIEVIAPGAFVYSTYPMNLKPFFNDYRGYEYDIGTSMAAPYVCGFLADLKQMYPRYGLVQLRYLLHVNTIPIAPKSKTGYGLIYAKY